MGILQILKTSTPMPTKTKLQSRLHSDRSKERVSCCWGCIASTLEKVIINVSDDVRQEEPEWEGRIDSRARATWQSSAETGRERESTRKETRTYNPRTSGSRNLQDNFWFRSSSSHHLSKQAKEKNERPLDKWNSEIETRNERDVH